MRDNCNYEPHHYELLIKNKIFKYFKDRVYTMRCRMCKFWLRDVSFPGNAGFCSAKNATTDANDSCELFRRKDEESIAIKVISY